MTNEAIWHPRIIRYGTYPKYEAIFSAIDLDKIDRRVTKKSRRGAPEELNYEAMIFSFAVRYVGTNLNDRGFK